MINVLKNLWKEADSLLDYTVALWISALFALAVSGILALTIRMITNPSSFENATFGIFDTLGS